MSTRAASKYTRLDSAAKDLLLGRFTFGQSETAPLHIEVEASGGGGHDVRVSIDVIVQRGAQPRRDRHPLQLRVG